MDWLISANSKIYDHASSFEHYGYIDWRQSGRKYQVGDVVYIYCTRPLSRIRYKCQITITGLKYDEIRDDREYWHDINEYKTAIEGEYARFRLIDNIDTERLSLNLLMHNGLKGAPQGAKKLSGELLGYIQKNFSEDNMSDVFPNEIEHSEEIFEGLKKKVVVNRYERSTLARAKCIEHHGYSCKICGMNFKQFYGYIGESFIHVHHIVPLHKINKDYKIDYKSDLIPVCANCHAMLHKKINGKEMTIKQLKILVDSNKKQIKDDN